MIDKKYLAPDGAPGGHGAPGRPAFKQGVSEDGKTMYIEFDSFGMECGIVPSLKPAQGDYPAREVVMWDREHSLIAIDKMTKLSEQYETLEFGGHPDPWVMIAMFLQKAPTCTMQANIPVFSKSYAFAPMRIGEVPENTDMTVEFQEDGDNLLVLCTLLNKATPDANLAIIIPEIPEGKTVYLKILNHAPIFIPVGVATAYADKCKAIFVKERYNDDYRCCVTHTDEYKVGDLVKNPYA